MLEVINQFSDLIEEYTILKNETTPSGLYRFKARLKLKNGTKLDVYERLSELDRNYSYHWTRWNNTLIIRWDNAKHHPDIENFPHHKHISSDENIESSDEKTFEKVFKYILQFATVLVILYSLYLFW